MAASGWYPDPSGAPGRFRYWDGSQWMSDTTADPAMNPPSAPAQPSSGKGSKTWIVALVVLALIVAVVAIWALRGTGGPAVHGSATEDTNSSTPTVSAWDETSTPSATPTTPPPTPLPSNGQWVDCPQSSGTAHTPQVPGRLSADTLSAPTIDGWSTDIVSFPAAYDTHSQYLSYGSAHFGWQSDIMVGLVNKADGFTDMATTATQLMDCWATSEYYQGFTNREDLVAGEAVTVSGHDAWRVESNIHVDDPDAPGGTVDLVVVDLGPNVDHWGLFMSAVVIGDSDRGAQVDAVRAALTVTG